MTLRSGGLFAGYGGLDMAVAQVFGAEPAWFSEIEDAPSKILAHHWPTVPNHGDITQIDWDEVEPVDILSGGFPCQDVSLAGKRAGMTADTRSGLWTYFAAGIAALRPRCVVIENVRGLLSAEAHSDVEPCPWCLGDGPGEPPLRAIGAVLGDLADLGYDAQWCGLRAADVGAPHGRYRIFVLAADSGGERRDGRQEVERGGWAPAIRQQAVDNFSNSAGRPTADSNDAGRQQHGRPVAVRPELAAVECGGDPAADTDGDPVREQPVSEPRRSREAIPGLVGGPAADTTSNGRHEGWTEPARERGGPDAAECCPTCDDPVDQHDADGFCAGRCGGSCTDPDWGRGLNAYATEDRSRQDVRDLREGLHSAPVRESTRGQIPLPITSPLLAGMREHEAGGEQGREPLAGEEAQGHLLLGVRDNQTPPRPPQGQESGEQRPGEPADAVRLLSPEAALAGGPGEPTCGCATWGQYAPAIHRWERILGRLAPEPTQVGPKGTRRLSPLAVEFMMGLPAGHVTAVPGVNRNAQLKALGNGVVPQQAIAALRHMHIANQLLATA